MSIKNNTTALQSLLEKANALPEASNNNITIGDYVLRKVETQYLGGKLS